MSYAPLYLLDSVYSLEDMYDILEKASVDAHNAKLIDKANKRGRR